MKEKKLLLSCSFSLLLIFFIRLIVISGIELSSFLYTCVFTILSFTFVIINKPQKWIIHMRQKKTITLKHKILSLFISFIFVALKNYFLFLSVKENGVRHYYYNFLSYINDFLYLSSIICFEELLIKFGVGRLLISYSIPTFWVILVSSIIFSILHFGEKLIGLVLIFIFQICSMTSFVLYPTFWIGFVNHFILDLALFL